MKPQYIEWDNSALIGIAGKSGTGKTSTLRLLLAQAVAAGNSIIVIDGHGNAGNQTIAQAARLFEIPVYTTPEEILDVLHKVEDEGNARLAGGPRDKFLIIIDELVSVLDKSEDSRYIVRVLQRIADEFRKVDIRAIIAAQNWGKDFIGAASIRRSLNPCIMHRMATDEVKYFTNNAQAIKDVPNLAKGQAFILSGDTHGKVTIPYVSADDLAEKAK